MPNEEKTLYVQGIEASSSARAEKLFLATKTGSCVSDEIRLTVVAVEIAELDRVPPGISRLVDVTVTPSLFPSATSIELSCRTMSGTQGSANVLPETITETTTVSVTGEDQSWGEPNNISLVAILAGATCAEEAFTVCAHPRVEKVVGGWGPFNPVTDLWYGMITYEIRESDAADRSITHLDKVYIKEDLYNAYHDEPPFYNSDDVDVHEGDWFAADGQSVDWITMAPEVIYNYLPGTCRVNQQYRFHCLRCLAQEPEDGDVMPSSGYVIEREVDDYDPEEGFDWRLETSKVGTSGEGGFGVIQDLLEE